MDVQQIGALLLEAHMADVQNPGTIAVLQEMLQGVCFKCESLNVLIFNCLMLSAAIARDAAATARDAAATARDAAEAAERLANINLATEQTGLARLQEERMAPARGLALFCFFISF